MLLVKSSLMDEIVIQAMAHGGWTTRVFNKSGNNL